MRVFFMARNVFIRTETRHWVSVENSHALQRLEINFCGVRIRALIGSMRADDELRFGTASDVRLKNFVWIEKIRNNHRELGKKILKVLIENSVACKETGERSRFDGFHRVS